MAANDSTQREKKTVKFPDDEESMAKVVCEIECREDLTEEEIETLFFNKAEYSANRQKTKRISRDSERQGFSKKLEKSFVEKSSEVQDRLNDWALHGHERRGLERWANRDHGEKRQQLQFQAIMAVLQEQEDLISSGKVDEEKLRKVSYKSTKEARHFARMMGKADAFAVDHQDQAAEDSSDAASTRTDLSSMTEATDDNISLPRMPDDEKHPKQSKSKYMLPNFLQRPKIRNNKNQLVKDRD